MVLSDFLSIGEVAERTGVAVSAMRYYEREGLLSSRRTDGGQRRFHRDVLRRVAFIRVAQRVGLTLEEIRDALATLPEGRTPTKADWERLSRSWRPQLDEQIAMLQRLREDLTSCIGCGCLSLKACAALQPRRRGCIARQRPPLSPRRHSRFSPLTSSEHATGVTEHESRPGARSWCDRRSRRRACCVAGARATSASAAIGRHRQQ